MSEKTCRIAAVAVSLFSLILLVSPTAHTATTADVPNANSIVEDNIEYYMQTDKAVYDVRENVQMLYRVTNVGDEDVEFVFTYGGLDNTCNWMVDKDGLRIWDNLDRPGTTVMTHLVLSPSQSYVYTHTWDMTDNDGENISPGNYTVTGVLGYCPPHERYVPVSVSIDIIHEPETYVNPGESIQARIDDPNVIDGDTIIVYPGTYVENINFNGKNITLRSTDPNDPDVVADTIIDGSNNPDSVVTFTGTENETCLLFGLTIRNGFQDYNPPKGGGGICGGSEQNHTRATIKNNIITLNFSRDGGGLYWCDGFIENNIITANFARWYQGGGGLSQCNGIIRCNLIAGNISGGCESGSGLSHCNGTIENNTITGNFSYGFETMAYCYGTIRNCIIWGNSPVQTWWLSTPSFSCIEGWSGGDGNIDTDPYFVEPGHWDVNGTPDDKWDDVWINGDYHLLPDSPCIDTGDPNYIPEPNEIDLDGNPRFVNGRIDMGTYEYIPPISAEVDIDPNILNLNSKGIWITAFIWLPEEYNVTNIDPNSIFLQGDIEPERFWLTEDNQIAIAKFNRENVQAILSIGEVELTITGRLTDGTIFEGADVITVIDKGGGKKSK